MTLWHVAPYFVYAKLIFSAKDYEVADEIADVALSDKDLYTFLNQKFENYKDSFHQAKPAYCQNYHQVEVEG